MRVRSVIVCAAVCLGLGPAALSASSEASGDLVARAKGAQKVVVAKVVSVQSRFDVNEFGDELIVSDAFVHVEETLKGPFAAALSVTVEGGTVGELTLDVSDMPSFRPGERAVLFLDATDEGGHRPNGRGLGVLKLDGANRVRGGQITLGEVRRIVHATSR